MRVSPAACQLMLLTGQAPRHAGCRCCLQRDPKPLIGTAQMWLSGGPVAAMHACSGTATGSAASAPGQIAAF